MLAMALAPRPLAAMRAAALLRAAVGPTAPLAAPTTRKSRVWSARSSSADTTSSDSGGAISQVVAVNHPERLGRVVLTNCDMYDDFPPKLFSYFKLLPYLPGSMAILGRTLKIRALWGLPFVFGRLANEIDGVKIDLRTVKTPAYILSTKEDHIAPWKSTYAATQLYSGPRRFVLGASGHIAGVINPPVAKKYGYWTNTELPAEPDAWLAGAEMHEGSWWLDWAELLKAEGGGEVKAPKGYGNKKHEPLAPAPGTYVFEK